MIITGDPVRRESASEHLIKCGSKYNYIHSLMSQDTMSLCIEHEKAV